MFLKMDTSKLLIPGPVIKVLDRVPSVPTAGIWNTLVRKAWLKVCSLLDKTGLPVTTMRGDVIETCRKSSRVQGGRELRECVGAHVGHTQLVREVLAVT